MTRRNYRIGAVVLLCLLFTSSSCAQGAGAEWETLTQKAIDLHRTGNYDRAVTVAKQSLELAEKNAGPDHPHGAHVRFVR